MDLCLQILTIVLAIAVPTQATFGEIFGSLGGSASGTVYAANGGYDYSRPYSSDSSSFQFGGDRVVKVIKVIIPRPVQQQYSSNYASAYTSGWTPVAANTESQLTTQPPAQPTAPVTQILRVSPPIQYSTPVATAPPIPAPASVRVQISAPATSFQYPSATQFQYPSAVVAGHGAPVFTAPAPSPAFTQSFRSATTSYQAPTTAQQPFPIHYTVAAPSSPAIPVGPYQYSNQVVSLPVSIPAPIPTPSARSPPVFAPVPDAVLSTQALPAPTSISTFYQAPQTTAVFAPVPTPAAVFSPPPPKTLNTQLPATSTTGAASLQYFADLTVPASLPLPQPQPLPQQLPASVPVPAPKPFVISAPAPIASPVPVPTPVPTPLAPTPFTRPVVQPVPSQPLPSSQEQGFVKTIKLVIDESSSSDFDGASGLNQAYGPPPAFSTNSPGWQFGWGSGHVDSSAWSKKDC